MAYLKNENKQYHEIPTIKEITSCTIFLLTILVYKKVTREILIGIIRLIKNNF